MTGCPRSVESAQDGVSLTRAEPAWHHYRNEPDALYTVALLHREQIKRDPGNAAWYRAEIAEIEARLDGLAA